MVNGWQLRSSFMAASLRVTLLVSVLICGALAATAPLAGATVLPARAAPHELAAGLAGDGFGFCAMLKSGWGGMLGQQPVRRAG